MLNSYLNMKNLFKIIVYIGLVFLASSFGAHKFYVAIYQIHHNQEKKSLEITSRIFIDDLNKGLEKKYGQKMHLGDSDESENDIFLMKKYVSENFSVKVNGKPQQMHFLSKEIENNVLICYFKCTDIPKINTLEIGNKILFDYVTEQQNIIQTTIYGKKNSLLLTVDDPSGKLSF